MARKTRLQMNSVAMMRLAWSDADMLVVEMKKV
jgi:hypothetical protein